MKLLILGGTKFLGRHLVEGARAGGHNVTLFHRGQTGCETAPEVEHIHGDRDGDLHLLAGRVWDAAIDTCGYVPRLVQASATALADAVGHYTFVSSISVYPKFTVGMDENAPVHTLDDPTTEEVTGETYGGLKVLCERAAETAMPGRVLHVRSGLIVGPYDPTDRFTYWVRRISMGGKFAVASPPERPMQIVHGRDLADWMLHTAERGVTGVFNVTGPGEPFTMSEMINACREVSGSNAEPVYMGESFLNEHKVAWWQELPLCIAEDDRGVMAVSTARAQAEGLTLRPLWQTARETLAWDANRPMGTELKAGLTPEREAELLAAWGEAGA